MVRFGATLAVLAIAIGVAASSATAQQTEYNGTITLWATMTFQGVESGHHAVSLRQDNAGVVRVLVSLTGSPEGTYGLALFRTTQCGAEWAPADPQVIEAHAVERTVDDPAALMHFDTTAVSLSAGAANTLYDSDGTALGVYSEDGALVGCAEVSAAPAEWFFNYQITLEFAVAFPGTDGKEHYVTLSQDTAGVVLVRLQLTGAPQGDYQVVTYGKAACASPGNFSEADIIEERLLARQVADPASLTYDFYTTNAVSISPTGPKSIYDADGTAIAVYQPGGSLLGCADISVVSAQPLPTATPGAPSVGTGVESSRGGSAPAPLLALALVVIAAGAFGAAALRGA